ncbi:hypothetical protein [Pseudomonas sp. OHS18]|uniref:hypothetical protein n=1 Tax=Pseudomonas sp. OHS18 TaxID=3399679 RepID=UPI003A87986E
MQINKRFAAALLTAALLPFTLAHAGQTPVPSHAVQQQAAGYSVRVGDIRVTALSDGTVPIDLHALLRGATPKTSTNC